MDMQTSNTGCHVKVSHVNCVVSHVLAATRILSKSMWMHASNKSHQGGDTSFCLNFRSGERACSCSKYSLYCSNILHEALDRGQRTTFAT